MAHNRLVTNLYNAFLLYLFTLPDQALVKGLLSNANSDQVLKQYIADQTGGASEGQFSLDRFLSSRGQGPRLTALAVNEGKKQALRRFQVR